MLGFLFQGIMPWASFLSMGGPQHVQDGTWPPRMEIAAVSVNSCIC